MTKKKKTTDFYKRKRADIKKRKRELTSNAGGMDAEQVKIEKKRLKEEYRGLKRSEKQQVQKEIEETLSESEIELLAESIIESNKQEFINEMEKPTSDLTTEEENENEEDK
ncbi:MAG: hypothetical protein Q8O88_03590 [bacterium]|nr:hypothetical protein [bacterium]